MTDESTTFQDQLATVIASVARTDAAFAQLAWERLDSLTKPPRSLGRLEEIATRMARIQHDVRPSVDRKAILVMAGDHGVVDEGVSAFPRDVTWQMVANFSAGGAAINQLAETVGAELRVYDVGVAADVSELEGVTVEKVMAGTDNMAKGPAMSREDCARAVLVGVQAAREVAEQGVTLIGTGEMGIGNSTAAAAITAALAHVAIPKVVGRGTGLDDEGVRRKAEVIQRAFDVNEVAELDALGVLAAVGGLEIAALAGVVIGAAEEGVCVVSDGFIAGSATLAAVSLCPAALDYVMPSHLSVEPGHQAVLDALDLKPVLALDMRLGEGTGAALAMGIIDAACRMMSGMATFAEAGVSSAGE